MTVLIGAFAGLLALFGVIYSKNKERQIKEYEIFLEKEQEFYQSLQLTHHYLISQITNYVRYQSSLIKNNLDYEKVTDKYDSDLKEDTGKFREYYAATIFLQEKYHFCDDKLFDEFRKKIMIQSSNVRKLTSFNITQEFKETYDQYLLGVDIVLTEDMKKKLFRSLRITHKNTMDINNQILDVIYLILKEVN